jgi:hypothetical protein
MSGGVIQATHCQFFNRAGANGRWVMLAAAEDFNDLSGDDVFHRTVEMPQQVQRRFIGCRQAMS